MTHTSATGNETIVILFLELRDSFPGGKVAGA